MPNLLTSAVFFLFHLFFVGFFFFKIVYCVCYIPWICLLASCSKAVLHSHISSLYFSPLHRLAPNPPLLMVMFLSHLTPSSPPPPDLEHRIKSRVLTRKRAERLKYFAKGYFVTSVLEVCTLLDYMDTFRAAIADLLIGVVHLCSCVVTLVTLCFSGNEKGFTVKQ